MSKTEITVVIPEATDTSTSFGPAVFNTFDNVVVKHLDYMIKPEEIGFTDEDLNEEQIKIIEKQKAIFIENAKKESENADLVFVPGGKDIKPEWYGQEPHEETDKRSPFDFRDEVEIEMIKVARRLDKTFMGICRGAQLAAIALSGEGYGGPKIELIQHLPDVTEDIHVSPFHTADEARTVLNEHIESGAYAEALAKGIASTYGDHKYELHHIRVKYGTILHELMRKGWRYNKGYSEDIVVKELSFHHQAIEHCPEKFEQNGMILSTLSAIEGGTEIVEGWEYADSSMFVTIQSHPEFNATGWAKIMFSELVEYARYRKAAAVKEEEVLNYLKWSDDGGGIQSYVYAI